MRKQFRLLSLYNTIMYDREKVSTKKNQKKIKIVCVSMALLH